MFSRPRADDEERDAEDSCKKGGRLLQLLPLHQELLLFVTFGFPQVASHFLLAWTSNFSAPCWHKIVSLSLLAINLICCSPSSYFSYCSLFFFPPPFFTCLSWPWIVHRRTSRIAHTYIWWKQSLPFHSLPLPLLAVFVLPASVTSIDRAWPLQRLRYKQALKYWPKSTPYQMSRRTANSKYLHESGKKKGLWLPGLHTTHYY